MEVVKLLILAALATLCHSQSGVPPPAEPEMLQYSGVRAYRTEQNYISVYVTSLYNDTRDARLRHYNCLERNSSGGIINRVSGEFVFSVFLQMPVLHFLNVHYKTELMESITTMLNIPNTVGTPRICVDGYDQAFVGEFEEGVLLRIYQRPFGGAVPALTGEQLLAAFNGNRGRFGTYGNPARAPLTRFEGEVAIYYNFSGRAAVIGAVWNNRVSINLGGCRQLNPYYNNFNSLTTQDLSCRSLSTDEQEDLQDNLAENPNPVNLYLEAGDYVFAVIGSIVVAIVLGLAITGYFIHPFFFA